MKPTNSNSQVCTMGSYKIGDNIASQFYYNDDNVFTIEKPPASCNIRIYLTTLADAIPVWATIGPQVDFYFRIYGVKK
jgi:hypothetical protein